MSPRITVFGKPPVFVLPAAEEPENSSSPPQSPLPDEKPDTLIGQQAHVVPALSLVEVPENSSPPPQSPRPDEQLDSVIAQQTPLVPALPVEADLENSSPPPQNPRPEEQRYYNFWGYPISRMEKQSQLSTMQTVSNMAYKLVWGAISLPQLTISKAVNSATRFATKKVVEAVAVKGIGLVHTPEPITALKQLYDCLKNLSEITSREASVYIEVSPEQKEHAYKTVDDFLLRQKTYLEESYDPNTGFKMGLDFAQENKFRILSQALKENTPLEGPFIKNLYDFIKKCWESQQQFHVKKKTMQLLGNATSSTPPIPISTKQTESKELSRFYETLTSAAPKPVPPKNAIPLINQQIDNLKSLGFKIGLALLILPERILHQPNEQNGGLLPTLIEKSEKALEPLKDSNEIFQNLIFTALDDSDLNFVQKTWKKFLCVLLAPSVLFIIDHLLEQSKDLVFYLIGISPEERLKLIFKMFIEPGREFISKLQSEYLSLAQNAGTVQTTPERAISNAIANIKIKDRNLKDLTPKDLINRLVSALLNQYAPSLNWASTATEHFEKRAEKALPLFFIIFTGLSYLSWVVNLITAPARWCLHKVIRKILKMVAVNAIHSKLKDSSDSSWDFGKLALHSLYKTLLNKLKNLSRLKTTGGTEKDKSNLAIEQTAFVDKDIQDNINKLVSSFLKLLYIQGSDLIGLSQKLAPNNNVEQTKLAAMDLILAPGVQKATEQIIHGLQTFLQEELFSAGILEVLQDIAQQCRPINSGRTKENPAHTEQDFYTQLQETVKSGIQEAINEKLDPAKHIQEEANLFIDGLKYDIAFFKKRFNAIFALEASNIIEGIKHDIAFFSEKLRAFRTLEATHNITEGLKKEMTAFIEKLSGTIRFLEASNLIGGLKHDIAFFSEKLIALRSMKDSNTIEGLKKEIVAFTEKMNGTVRAWEDSNINNLIQSRNRLLFDAFKRHFERARDSTNDNARLFIKAITEKFFDLRKPISENIINLGDLTAKLKKTNDLTEELGQLIPTLTKATLDSQPLTNATKFYSELQLTLPKIKDNRYPQSVQHYILKLQRAFESWKTETEKRNNHSNLNGHILTIREEVDIAITKNKIEVEKLLKQIQDERQQAAQHVAALAEWATTLTYFDCKVEASDINLAQQIFAQYAGSIPGGLSPLILKQLDAFFQFLGKDHNIKGLLWYVIKAYLETPPKPPQEFEKILSQVREKIKLSLKTPAQQ